MHWISVLIKESPFHLFYHEETKEASTQWEHSYLWTKKWILPNSWICCNIELFTAYGMSVIVAWTYCTTQPLWLSQTLNWALSVGNNEKNTCPNSKVFRGLHLWYVRSFITDTLVLNHSTLLSQRTYLLFYECFICRCGLEYCSKIIHLLPLCFLWYIENPLAFDLVTQLALAAGIQEGMRKKALHLMTALLASHSAVLILGKNTCSAPATSSAWVPEMHRPKP